MYIIYKYIIHYTTMQQLSIGVMLFNQQQHKTLLNYVFIHEIYTKTLFPLPMY